MLHPSVLGISVEQMSFNQKPPSVMVFYLLSGVGEGMSTKGEDERRV